MIKSAPKNWKTIFYQDKFCYLKAPAHYFFVLIYLPTWRAAKLVFLLITSINVPRCGQSINSLVYVYYTDPQMLFMSAWSQLWSHFFILLPSKKNFCISPPLIYIYIYIYIYIIYICNILYIYIHIYVYTYICIYIYTIHILYIYNIHI